MYPPVQCYRHALSSLDLQTRPLREAHRLGGRRSFCSRAWHCEGGLPICWVQLPSCRWWPVSIGFRQLLLLHLLLLHLLTVHGHGARRGCKALLQSAGLSHLGHLVDAWDALTALGWEQPWILLLLRLAWLLLLLLLLHMRCTRRSWGPPGPRHLCTSHSGGGWKLGRA